jgi:hypothetical protein
MRSQDEDVLIVKDLIDMIFAARTCKGRGKKCYLTEAVSDLVIVMKENGHYWPREVVKDLSVYIADIRAVISVLQDAEDVVVVVNVEEDTADEAIMLEAAMECENAKIRERLVARWKRNKKVSFNI